MTAQLPKETKGYELDVFERTLCRTCGLYMRPEKYPNLELMVRRCPQGHRQRNESTKHTS